MGDRNRVPLTPRNTLPRRRFVAAAAASVLGVALPRMSGATTGESARAARLRLFLCGDVMTGRGVDQILPYPCSPELYEPAVSSALGYVDLAERANGPIPRPAPFDYPWGDALDALARYRPDVRIVNLETSVTRHPEPLPKGINYRMSPENFPCVSALGPDCCVLANNHVLDWGEAGLTETLETIEAADIAIAGAGRTAEAAAAPAVLPVGPGRRVLVFAFGHGTSGIPDGWRAGPDRPGVELLPDLSPRTGRTIAARIAAARQPGDIVVASVHWGGNWGYEVSRPQREFARFLVTEAGVDVVHGHSSHHPRAAEIHAGRLILYGCGDFLNDYEGIGGYEEYRDDLVLMYLPDVGADGRLRALTMVPFRIRHFRLNRPGDADIRWLADTMDRECRPFGGRVRAGSDGTLGLGWGKGERGQP